MSKDSPDDPPPEAPAQFDMFGPVQPGSRVAREREAQAKPPVRTRRAAPAVSEAVSQPVLPMPRPGEAPEPPRKPRPKAKTVGRVMKEHELASPVDISDQPIDRGDSLRWTSMTIAVATIALLCANAGTLSGWLDEKDPTPMQQRASTMATGWVSAMDAIGITAPRHKLHETWKKLQAARFGDEAPGGSQ